MPLELPHAFGKYTLVDRIASGGMAEVFRAKVFGVAGFEKVVAVKRILPHFAEDDGFVDMFVREANIAVKLTHSNIVQVFELGRVAEHYYIALELVEGRDLKTVIREAGAHGKVIPPGAAALITQRVCAGLHHAHSVMDEGGKPLGIVHRDVSPHNVLVSWSGEVKVADFGIAKLQSGARNTRTGMLKGKLAYMSPEQSEGDPDLDGRSDVFAAGIVLYECLTGLRPFEGESDREIVRALREKVPPPPSALAPGISAELDDIASRAMEKKRELRFQDAGAMGKALGAYLQRHGGATGNAVDSDDIAAVMRDTLGGPASPRPSNPHVQVHGAGGTPILDSASLLKTAVGTIGMVEAAEQVFAGTITRPHSGLSGPSGSTGSPLAGRTAAHPTATRPSRRAGASFLVGAGAGVAVLAGLFAPRVIGLLAPSPAPTHVAAVTALSSTPTPLAPVTSITPVTPSVAFATFPGRAKLDGTPRSASIFVGSARMGSLGEALSLPYGTHALTVSAEYHRPQTIRISLDAAAPEVTRTVNLVRGRGELRVGRGPHAAAEFIVPGVLEAKDFRATIPDVPAGAYRAEVREGGRKLAVTVIVRDGKTTKVIFPETLTPGLVFAP